MQINIAEIKTSASPDVAGLVQAEDQSDGIGGLAGVFAELLAGFQKIREQQNAETDIEIDVDGAIEIVDSEAEEVDAEIGDAIEVDIEVDDEIVEVDTEVDSEVDTEIDIEVAVVVKVAVADAEPADPDLTVTEVAKLSSGVQTAVLTESVKPGAAAKLVGDAGSVARIQQATSLEPAEEVPDTKALLEMVKVKPAVTKKTLGQLITESDTSEEVLPAKGLLQVIKPVPALELPFQEITNPNSRIAGASTVPAESRDVPTATVRNVGDVTIRSVRHLLGSNEESIQIRLVPRSLGELNITVTTIGDRVEVIVSSASAMVREVLDEQLVGLRETLLKEGVEVSSIRVEATQKQEPGSFQSHAQAKSHDGKNAAGQPRPSVEYEEFDGNEHPDTVPRNDDTRRDSYDGDLNVFA